MDKTAFEELRDLLLEQAKGHVQIGRALLAQDNRIAAATHLGQASTAHYILDYIQQMHEQGKI